MSMKKIQKADAATIAHEMVCKAFAHNLLPLMVERKKIIEEMFFQELEVLGLNVPYIRTLKDHGVLRDDFYISTEVSFVDAKGKDIYEETIGAEPRYSWNNSVDLEDFGQKLKNDETTARFPISSFTIRTPAAVQRLVALNKPINTLRKCADELADELRRNMVGRTCKEVFKEWPQAAPFLVKHFQLDVKTPSMAKPLEDILGKYLMLAAPEMA